MSVCVCVCVHMGDGVEEEQKVVSAGTSQVAASLRRLQGHLDALRDPAEHEGMSLDCSLFADHPTHVFSAMVARFAMCFKGGLRTKVWRSYREELSSNLLISKHT